MKAIRILFIIIIFLLKINSVYAGGFDNASVGLKGFSMGCAYTGIADDASAVYYNPGALAFNQKDKIYLEGYGYIIFTGLEYKEPGGTYESDEPAFIPGFFISKTYDKWGIGFGNYVPFAGGGVEYDNFRQTGMELTNAAGLLANTFAFGYQINKNIAAGAGVTFYIGQMETDFRAVGGTKDEFDGYSGYGFNFGVMYRLLDNLNMGITFESSVDIEIEGETKGLGDSEVEFKLPYTLSLGLGYKPNDDLTLSFEISHMDYSSMDHLTFKYENMTVEQSTYYRDTMLIAFGVEYKLNGQWGLQGGCYYTQGASRNKRWHFATNDVDLIVPSIGFYYDISEKIELNVTGFYVWGIEEKNNNQTYDQDNPILLAGVRCVL